MLVANLPPGLLLCMTLSVLTRCLGVIDKYITSSSYFSFLTILARNSDIRVISTLCGIPYLTILYFVVLGPIPSLHKSRAIYMDFYRFSVCFSLNPRYDFFFLFVNSEPVFSPACRSDPGAKISKYFGIFKAVFLFLLIPYVYMFTCNTFYRVLSIRLLPPLWNSFCSAVSCFIH